MGKGRPLFAFLYDTPANINNLLPVFQAAQERGWHPTVLTGEGVDLGRKGLNGEVFSSVSVNGLMAATTVKERLKALVRACQHYRSIVSELQQVEPTWEKAIKKSRTWILTELTLFTALSLGLRRLYATWEPSCVVSTSDFWPFDHAVFAEAKRHRVPSFVIQHGLTDCYWWPFIADKQLLWGKPFEDELLRLGTPAERLAVCGMPAADHLFTRDQGEAANRPHKAASSYVILSHTQMRTFEPELYTRYGTSLKAIVAATPSTRWSIKLHPMEDESFYRDMLDGSFPNFSILPKSTSLEDAVTQADVACTLFSASGLQAMMMRKPLVVIDVGPMIREFAWWPKFGGGTYVSTVDTMLDFVKKALAGEQFLANLVTKQDQFLAENFANPGRAAEAVLDNIGKTLASIPGSSAKEVASETAPGRTLFKGSAVSFS